MILLIVISAVQLAMDNPLLDPSSKTKVSLYLLDYISLGIFTLEAIAKIIAHGFYFTGHFSYFKSGWNVLDFVILVFSYLCLTPLVSTFKVVKAFKI
jgi:voltage-gated sodium channel